MSEYIPYASLVGGLILLTLAGDWLVSGALSAAKRAGVSPLVGGILIVGFGTSAPEMVVTVDAALAGTPGLALGNIVGSNIANIFLVLSVPALIAPIAVGVFGQRRAYTTVAIATVFWVAVTAMMPLTPLIGLIMLGGLAIYAGVTVAWTLHGAAKGIDVGVETDEPDMSTTAMLLAIAAGVIGLPLGAHLIVVGGVGVAREFDVPEEVIGLTLLAIGTSLPELGAGVAAALRKNGDVVIGNVLGSNVFNILAAGGLVSLFGPLALAPTFAQYDHWVLIASTLVFGTFIFARERISRLAAIAMLLSYILYIYGLISGWNILGGVMQFV